MTFDSDTARYTLVNGGEKVRALADLNRNQLERLVREHRRDFYLSALDECERWDGERNDEWAAQCLADIEDEILDELAREG